MITKHPDSNRCAQRTFSCLDSARPRSTGAGCCAIRNSARAGATLRRAGREMRGEAQRSLNGCAGVWCRGCEGSVPPTTASHLGPQRRVGHSPCQRGLALGQLDGGHAQRPQVGALRVAAGGSEQDSGRVGAWATSRVPMGECSNALVASHDLGRRPVDGSRGCGGRGGGCAGAGGGAGVDPGVRRSGALPRAAHAPRAHRWSAPRRDAAPRPESFTAPLSASRMLRARTSPWIRPASCRYSRACTADVRTRRAEATQPSRTHLEHLAQNDDDALLSQGAARR